MERNRIAFDNEDFSIQRLKNSFVCNLWLWTKLVVNEGALMSQDASNDPPHGFI